MNYTEAQVVEILKAVLASGFGAISFFSKELEAMKVTEEELKANEDQERVAKANLLINYMTVINNIIHRGHKISLELFGEENKAFIEYLMSRQKAAHDNKLISECECCKPQVAEVAEPAVEVVSSLVKDKSHKNKRNR